MDLSILVDYSIIFGFFVLSISIGIWVSKTSGKNTKEYFVWIEHALLSFRGIYGSYKRWKEYDLETLFFSFGY